MSAFSHAVTQAESSEAEKRHPAERDERADEIPAPTRLGKGRPKKDLGITRDDLERRYESGETIRAIAASLGCGFTTLQRRLHAEGIEVRSGGGNSRRATRSQKPGRQVIAVIRSGPHKGCRIRFPELLDKAPPELTVNQHAYVRGDHVAGDGWWYYHQPPNGIFRRLCLP